MKKPEPAQLGTKRTCTNCATKFYDFQKDPIVCPKCSTKIEPNAPTPFLRAAPERKQKAEKSGPEAALTQDEEGGTTTSEFEIAEELVGDDDDGVEEVEVEDDADDDDKDENY